MLQFVGVLLQRLRGVLMRAIKRMADGSVVGCGVLIVHEWRILLLKRGMTAPTCPGMWGGPGGLLEEGETGAQAAVREVCEEAGIQVDLVSQEPFFSSRWVGDNRYIRYFLAHVNEVKDITFPDKEADAHVWATYEEARDLPLSFCYGEAIEKLRAEQIL